MKPFFEQILTFLRTLLTRRPATGETTETSSPEPQPTIQPPDSSQPTTPSTPTEPAPVIVLPAPEPVETEVKPVTRKLMSIIFNPHVPSIGNDKLNHAIGWNDPDTLTTNLIDDLREVSAGYVNYEVVEQHEVDTLPNKRDGFAYDVDEFVRCYRTNTGFHQPDDVDYYQILRDFDIISKILGDAIDEVWMFAPPYSGFHESTMAGAGAFFCNAPPLTGTEDCARRFIIMGFNYERGEGEMLESFNHRAESIMQQVYRQRVGAANLWERFTRVEKTNPDRAEVGTVHYAPNSTRAYEWGSHTLVPSRCENWLKYPDLTGDPIQVNCDNWGGGDIRLHHLWWLRHFSHFPGLSGGIANNWWKYVVDANTVR
jgi:hypothetical protein